MELINVIIDGFANLDRVELNLSKFNALIALNNYGKSNVIRGLDFGFDFIKNPENVKTKMMAYQPAIPINKNLETRPFSFEITFKCRHNKSEVLGIYGYSFDWIKNDKSKGQKIKEEYFKLKGISESKFKSYISRDSKGTFYLPSQTGRCDKPIKIEKNELVINKLKSFDDLFYLEVIKTINNIEFIRVETLRDPDKLFRTINPRVVTTDYSLEMPDSSNVAFFIYSLQKKNKHLYEIFKDAVLSLLPSIDDFKPIEIDFKKETSTSKSQSLPLKLPERLYDVIVKEKNNNQESGIDLISSGSQKIFFVLAMTVAADVNQIPLITFEELENSIHPGLLQKLLIAIDALSNNTKILLTSHSPYLIQYLDIEKIKIGVPNLLGTAVFKEVRKTKFNRLLRIASEDGVSIGDLIFDKMLECVNGEVEFFEELCE